MLIVVVLHLFCVGYGHVARFLPHIFAIVVQKPDGELEVCPVQRASGLVRVDPAEMAYCGTEVGLKSVCARLTDHVSTRLV